MSNVVLFGSEVQTEKGRTFWKGHLFKRMDNFWPSWEFPCLLCGVAWIKVEDRCPYQAKTLEEAETLLALKNL